MSSLASNRRIRLFSPSDLDREIDAFLIDRQARGLSAGSIVFYRQKLDILRRHLESIGVTQVEHITPRILRALLVDYARTHKPGGVHAVYRATRAFLIWYDNENEPQNWTNPIRKVQPPRVALEPLEPLSMDDLQAMLATCERRTFAGDRDKSILLCLLDSGCRAAEFCSLNMGDVNLGDGTVLVRQGKGNKPRVVFLGAKSRKALLAYLRHRPATTDGEPLWVTDTGARLSYAGLREIVRRRARKAGIAEPSLHSFRRAFALCSLRNGIDVYSLQRLMGHADLTVLRRYLAQNEGDLRTAHARSGPVDHLL
jgi:site-specific recombinase XerD